jgi:hypothetical protein
MKKLFGKSGKQNGFGNVAFIILLAIAVVIATQFYGVVNTSYNDMAGGLTIPNAVTLLTANHYAVAAPGGTFTGDVTGSISGGTVSGSTLTGTGLTSGKIPVASTGGLLIDGPAYSGGSITTNISGSSGSATTAVTATNLSGGSSNGTTVTASGNITTSGGYFVGNGSALTGLPSGITTGSTFPATPTDGQLFVHEVTGRQILYQYNTTLSAWQALRRYGTTTIFVDKTGGATAGTDDLLHGTASGNSAFNTLAYALSVVQGTIGGQIDIYLSAENYAENIEITGIFFTGYQGTYHYNLFIRGSLTPLATLTSTGNGVKGATSSLPTFVQTGLTDHAYNDKLLSFTSGSNNGLYKIIHHNDTTTITLASQTLLAQPVANDTATVCDWGTTLSGTIINGLTQMNTVLLFCNCTGVVTNHMGGLLSLMYCKAASYNVHDYAKSWIYDTLFSGALPLNVDETGHAILVGGKVTASGSDAISVYDQGNLYLLGGVVIDTANYGIKVYSNSVTKFIPSDVYNFISNCTVDGLFAYQSGTITGTATNQYASNGTNEVATSATFGYID